MLLYNLFPTSEPARVIAQQVSLGLAYLLVGDVLLREILRRALLRLLPAQCVKQLTHTRGAFCKNELEEMAFTSAVGVQHAVAGSLLLSGIWNGNLEMVRYGFLCEAGWALVDTVLIAFNRGIYANKSIRRKLKTVVVFHHLPPMLGSLPVILNDFHANEHFQNILTSLVVVSCVEIFLGNFQVLATTMGRSRVAFAVQSVETILFLYVRFHIFPDESYQFLQYIDSTLGWMFAAVTILLLFVLNTAIAVVKIKRLLLEFDAEWGSSQEMMAMPTPQLQEKEPSSSAFQLMPNTKNFFKTSSRRMASLRGKQKRSDLELVSAPWKGSSVEDFVKLFPPSSSSSAFIFEGQASLYGEES